jgi:hypothetical protein
VGQLPLDDYGVEEGASFVAWLLRRKGLVVSFADLTDSTRVKILFRLSVLTHGEES